VDDVDGQCQDDGDECIYIIGMDDGNATDYVQEWHQQGCFETYPVYTRESNDSGNEYLCNNYHWYATDQNCSEFDPFEGYTGRNPHELGQCSGKADIFACGGRPVDDYDGSVMHFVSDGDRHKRKLIVGCSEIDLFPPPALPVDASSICVQLEILPDHKIWRHRDYEFDGREGDTYYASFETSEHYSKNGKPIYMYESDAGRMYYVFSDGDRWIVSFETIRLEGIDVFDAIFCNEENLFDCTQNKWSIELVCAGEESCWTTVDRIKVTAGECDVNGLEWEHVDVHEQKKWVLPLIICGGIGGVALLLLGMYCWKRQAKKGQHGFKGNDESV